MADDQPPQPGAVPQFMQHQVTAPLPTHPANPWGIPAFQPPPAPAPKENDHAGIKLAIQIIMAALGVGTIIFAGGAANEKLKHIEENQRAADVRSADQRRQQDERDEKLADALERLSRKVDRQGEQLQVTGEHRRRRRRDSADVGDPNP